MRGIGSTFSRLPKVAAWLAGAAILAGTIAPGAHAQTDETAMAMPRLSLSGADGVALPTPLSAADAGWLRQGFANRDAPAAPIIRGQTPLDRSIRLNDEMLGHLAAYRFLAGRPRAAANDLADWLTRYPTLPDGPAIAALLHRRDPTRPIPASLAARPESGPAPVPEETPADGDALARKPSLDAAIRARLHDGNIDTAQRLIARTRGLSADYTATLQAEVAQALFTRNRDAAALTLADSAARRAHGRVGLADYIAGLAAWRQGQYQRAGSHFAAVSQASIATAALRAAGSYWAARTCLTLNDTAGYHAWLRDAGAQRRTFYGQIANRTLGHDDGLSFGQGVLGEADVDAVSAEPAGLRGFALLQIGQTGRAEQEFRLLALATPLRPPLSRAVMRVAERAGLYDVAADIAAALQQHGAAPLDGDRFPIPRLRPGHGFQMDPALVYALTRIESNFDPHAVSAMGAQGLMQLMPATANYIGAGLHGARSLHDPGVNLDLGQRYVAYLADHEIVDGDLIRLLAAYNSGPGAFSQWSEDIRDFNDPLLFIEAMPNDETRQFVQRAFAYTWIYAARLHLAAPSLDALAAFRFPRFSAPNSTQPIRAAALH